MKGSAVFAANNLFSEFELSYFEAGLAKFVEMGFPMEYTQIQAMMSRSVRCGLSQTLTDSHRLFGGFVRRSPMAIPEAM